MNPTFTVPLAATLGGQPGSLLTGFTQTTPLLGLHGAALAPILLGAFLWVVLMAAMRSDRGGRRRPAIPRPPVISAPPGDGMPAAA